MTTASTAGGQAGRGEGGDPHHGRLFQRRGPAARGSAAEAAGSENLHLRHPKRQRARAVGDGLGAPQRNLLRAR